MDLVKEYSLRFEVEGKTFYISPCIYDAEDESPGIRMVFPNGSSTSVEVSAFRSESTLKAFLNEQVREYLTENE